MTIADQLYQWALLFAGALYGYEQPPEPPTVAIVTHEFLVDRACGGVECKVLGWYNDEGIVYLDESIARRIETNALAQSILVHEFVHYLQHVSGRYPAGQCEVFIAREREAYAVSDTFLVNNGWVAGPHMGAFGTCAATYTAAPVETPCAADGGAQRTFVVTPACQVELEDCLIGAHVESVSRVGIRYKDGTTRGIRFDPPLQSVDAEGACYTDSLMWGISSDEMRDVERLALVGVE